MNRERYKNHFTIENAPKSDSKFAMANLKCRPQLGYPPSRHPIYFYTLTQSHTLTVTHTHTHTNTYTDTHADSYTDTRADSYTDTHTLETTLKYYHTHESILTYEHTIHRSHAHSRRHFQRHPYIHGNPRYYNN